MRFLHVADIHLGCRQYGLEERPKDFFRAWWDVIVNHAIPNKVDFVLIAGDFFHYRKVEPQAMNHAMAGLTLLKEAGIPVIAIEGNHDQRDSVSPYSWLRSLSGWGYLKLLEPAGYEEGHIKLLPWDEEERTGSYIDVAGARIFGSHSYGARANVEISLLADAVRSARVEGLFNILMLHTDIEGQSSHPIPLLSMTKLNELKQFIDYIALGHTHKRFDLDNWAFNPGSLETPSIDEYEEERGAYLVDIDDQHNIKAAHIRDYAQRSFERVAFDVSGAEDAEAVYNGVIGIIERESRMHQVGSGIPAPIIEITLKGHLGFNKSSLKLSRIEDEVKRRTGALHVRWRDRSVPVEYAVVLGLSAEASRKEREQRIIEDLIARNNRYKNRARHIANLVIKAKQLALDEEPTDKIKEFIKLELKKPIGETDDPAGGRER